MSRDRESYLSTIRKLRPVLERAIEAESPSLFSQAIAQAKKMARAAKDIKLPAPILITDPLPLDKCPKFVPRRDDVRAIGLQVFNPTMKQVWAALIVDNAGVKTLHMQDGTIWARDALQDWEFDVEHWPQPGQVRDIAKGFRVTWKDHCNSEQLKELRQYAAVHGVENLKQQRPKICAKYRQAKITARWLLGAADFFIHYLNDKSREQDETVNADTVHRFYMEARQLKPSLRIPGKDRMGRRESQAEMERLKNSILEEDQKAEPVLPDLTGNWSKPMPLKLIRQALAVGRQISLEELRKTYRIHGLTREHYVICLDKLPDYAKDALKDAV